MLVSSCDLRDAQLVSGLVPYGARTAGNFPAIGASSTVLGKHMCWLLNMRQTAHRRLFVCMTRVMHNSTSKQASRGQKSWALKFAASSKTIGGSSIV